MKPNFKGVNILAAAATFIVSFLIFSAIFSDWEIFKAGLTGAPQIKQQESEVQSEEAAFQQENL